MFTGMWWNEDYGGDGAGEGGGVKHSSSSGMVYTLQLMLNLH